MAYDGYFIQFSKANFVYDMLLIKNSNIWIQ